MGFSKQPTSQEPVFTPASGTAAKKHAAGASSGSSSSSSGGSTSHQLQSEVGVVDYWRDRVFLCFSTNLVCLWLGFTYLAGFQIHCYMMGHVSDQLEKGRAQQGQVGYIGRFMDLHGVALVLGTAWAILVHAFENSSRLLRVLNKVGVKYRVCLVMMGLCYVAWFAGYLMASSTSAPADAKFGEWPFYLCTWSHFVLAYFMAWFQATCLQLTGGLRGSSGAHWYLIGVGGSALPAVLLQFVVCTPALVYTINGCLLFLVVVSYVLLPCGLEQHPDLEKVIFQELKQEDALEEQKLLLHEEGVRSEVHSSLDKEGGQEEETYVSVCEVMRRNWFYLLTMWFTFVCMFVAIRQGNEHKTTWLSLVPNAGDAGVVEAEYDYNRWRQMLFGLNLLGDIFARTLSYFVDVGPTKRQRLFLGVLGWLLRPLLVAAFVFFLFDEDSRVRGAYSAWKLLAYIVMGFTTGYMCNGLFAVAMGGARSNEEREKLGPIMGFMLVLGIFSGIQLTGKILIPLAKNEPLMQNFPW